MMSGDSLVSLNDGILFTEMDGDFISLDVQSGKYFHLDAVASEIFRQLKTPRTVSELCEALGMQFKSDGGQIESDTFEFLNFLSVKGLVKFMR